MLRAADRVRLLPGAAARSDHVVVDAAAVGEDARRDERRLEHDDDVLQQNPDAQLLRAVHAEARAVLHALAVLAVAGEVPPEGQPADVGGEAQRHVAGDVQDGAHRGQDHERAGVREERPHAHGGPGVQLHHDEEPPYHVGRERYAEGVDALEVRPGVDDLPEALQGDQEAQAEPPDGPVLPGGGEAEALARLHRDGEYGAPDCEREQGQQRRREREGGLLSLRARPGPGVTHLDLCNCIGCIAGGSHGAPLSDTGGKTDAAAA
mmetsp:Transcript_82623/g.234366  ORF Transcript_82623/g.234366 Transcript_82623/m.234366 type:complete len:264 (-) Transcript_82623:23-814(-)